MKRPGSPAEGTSKKKKGKQREGNDPTVSSTESTSAPTTVPASSSSSSEFTFTPSTVPASSSSVNPFASVTSTDPAVSSTEFTSAPPTVPASSSSSSVNRHSGSSASTSAPDNVGQQKYHKACNQYGHSRSSYKLCPLYKPSPGKVPPPPKPLPGTSTAKSAAPDSEPGDEPPTPPDNAPPDNTDIHGKWIEEHEVYKCGFRKLLNTPPLEATVDNVVKNVTQACFQVSRLLQLHLQRVIENSLEIPDITNQTWLNRLFRLVEGRSPTRQLDDYIPDHLMTTYNTMYRTIIGTYHMNNSQIPIQIISYICQNYIMNLNRHIDTHYEAMNKLWVKQSLMRRGLPQTQARRLSLEIWDSCQDLGDNQSDAGERESFRQTWHTYTRPIIQSKATVPEKLLRMYRLNVIFTAWECKLYTLVPIYTQTAKYIRIDTNVLYVLLGTTRGTGANQTQFRARREEFFRTHFNLPARLFNADTRSPNFNFMIDTDGVGASVHIFRWKWIVIRPNETATERDSRLAEARAERHDQLCRNIQNRADEHDLQWVGIDPGRKTAIAAAKLDDENDHWSFKLSTAEYHHRIKANECKQSKEEQLRKAGVFDWLLQSPTMKTHCAASTLQCLQRSFETNHLHQIVDMNCTRKIKHMRWKVYIHRMKTIDQTCKSILGNDPSHTIIAFGAGKFNPTSRGYKSSPTSSSYLVNRLKTVHHATVLNIWEFNTSQICSKCQTPLKLCGVGTQHDPFTRQPANTVQNHHFVRRCTNNLCRTIWNRDINAARNMAFLGINLVYQVDRPDPFNASVPYPISVHDNDVLQAASPA